MLRGRSMKRTCATTILAFSLNMAIAGLGICDTLVANSVPNLTTVTVLTVPVGSTFSLRSVILAKNDPTVASSQRIFRSGAPVTGFMNAPSDTSVQINFDPPIVYTAGQQVQVRNGASSGPVSFTLVGN
jgi:hypothetical protein